MINHKFSLENAFQEILYRIDNWINEGSGWIVELIESQYINISTDRLLLRITHSKLPTELRSPKKRLVNMKNNEQKWLLWCHIRHINHVEIHPKRITQTDKELVKDLDYDGIRIPVDKTEFSRIKTNNNISINMYCCENKLTFLIYISDQEFENSMDFLLLTDENKSH